MDWQHACIAVIACLDEGRTIGSVVEQTLTRLPRVLVVDDGSTDGGGEEAHRAGAQVLRHEANLGKGAALRTGFRHASEAGFRWALTLDADGQHRPDDIPALLAAAAPGETDLVIGDRMRDANRMPWLRRRVNQWMSRRLSNLTGTHLPDTQSGFRLVRLAAWRQHPHRCDEFEVESEMLATFSRAGFRIDFVPVNTVVSGRPSRIRPARDTVRWLRWWLRAQREARSESA